MHNAASPENGDFWFALSTSSSPGWLEDDGDGKLVGILGGQPCERPDAVISAWTVSRAFPGITLPRVSTSRSGTTSRRERAGWPVVFRRSKARMTATGPRHRDDESLIGQHDLEATVSHEAVVDTPHFPARAPRDAAAPAATSSSSGLLRDTHRGLPPRGHQDAPAREGHRLPRVVLQPGQRVPDRPGEWGRRPSPLCGRQSKRVSLRREWTSYSCMCRRLSPIRRYHRLGIMAD